MRRLPSRSAILQQPSSRQAYPPIACEIHLKCLSRREVRSRSARVCVGKMVGTGFGASAFLAARPSARWRREEGFEPSDTVARMTHQDARCLKPLSHPFENQRASTGRRAEALCTQVPVGTAPTVGQHSYQRLKAARRRITAKTTWKRIDTECANAIPTTIRRPSDKALPPAK